jgi:putative ATP-dependent endonuclease of OLD family
MYLSKIQIANFRKIQSLDLELNRGLNLLVGENDSGKTAIIDAIKFILGTHSNDWLRLEKDDFYSADGKTYATEIKILCIFKNLSEDEAAMFLEWLSIEDSNYYLKLTFKAKRKENSNSISEISYDIKAGEDEESGVMSGEARNKLKVTYLKPLRDAEYELAPRKGSRLSQILANYDIFQTEKGEKHPLVDIMNTANTDVNTYFENDGKEILKKINDEYLKEFSLVNNGVKSKLDISPNELGKILEKLELKGISDSEVGNLGLGSNNLLFIAAEMLLLKGSNYTGLKLSLIEEIEAHLHPQSQINLIDFLSKQSENLGIQSIITTHSNSLASKVDLNNIIICKNGKVFSLRKSETKLNAGDYEFLRRFLDDTKANLFFANGVIMVEGDAENLFLPTFAEFIGLPLHKYGVSIVNVSSTALLRYAKIFQRKNNETIGIKVACITDRDIPPQEAGSYTYLVKTETRKLIPNNRKCENNFTQQELTHKESSIREKYSGGEVETFIPTTWTLEYEIAKSCLKKHLHFAIQIALETKNLEIGINIDKQKEILVRCNKQIREWKIGGDNESLIAVKIFSPMIWDKTKASKAVVAQILSLLIQKSKISKNTVLKDVYLKYLIDAITHVTNVQP